MIGYYYGSLIYANRTIGRQETKTYGKSVLLVNFEVFQKWPNELSEKVMAMNRAEHKVWIVPVPSCAM